MTNQTAAAQMKEFYMERKSKVALMIGLAWDSVLTYIDDHDGEEKELQGYVVVDGIHICPVIKNTSSYCLNSLYVSEDGELRLSRRSVGGIIVNLRYGTAEDAIEEYIEKYNNKPFSKDITSYSVFK